MMAVVHDLAEAQGAIITKTSYACMPSLAEVVVSLLTVGDIAPREGIPKAEKRRLEAVRLFLPSFPALIPSPPPPQLTSHLASSGSHAKLCARDVA